MVPPPPALPSQAGKFKPRKPVTTTTTTLGGAAKVIRVGAGTEHDTGTTATTSTTKGRGGNRGGPGDGDGRSGAGGGGRSGRGRGSGEHGRGRGRGRGRLPIAQGQVFFTGSALPSATSQHQQQNRLGMRGGAGRGGVGRGSGVTGGIVAGRGTRLLRKDLDTTRNEEILEIMEEGVGASTSASRPDATRSNAATARISSDAEALGRALDQEAAATAGAGSGFGSNKGGRGRRGAFPDHLTYDSDSSLEEQLATAKAQQPTQRRGRTQAHVKLEPLVLPRMKPLHELDHALRQPEATPSSALLQQKLKDCSLAGSSTGSRKKQSPFADPLNQDNLEAEKKSWFLVQLPTRLPVLQELETSAPTTTSATTGTGNTAAVGGATTSTASAIKIEDTTGSGAAMQDNIMADVAIKPLHTDCFDNALLNAAPGRLGKIRIHRSGKTVMVFEDSQGQATVRMNVAAGLQCNFLQQAVVIDKDASVFVPLGHVHKSIVMTPDLTNAFLSN